MRTGVCTGFVVFSLAISCYCIDCGIAKIAKSDNSNSMSGVASTYDRSSGNETASGEQLNEEALTAAHRELPLGTVVEVTNNRNKRKTLVRINDRGPFVDGRVIDLTPAGARVLGFLGLTDVSLAIISSPSR
jgi:rare lipoprotein A